MYTSVDCAYSWCDIQYIQKLTSFKWLPSSNHSMPAFSGLPYASAMGKNHCLNGCNCIRWHGIILYIPLCPCSVITKRKWISDSLNDFATNKGRNEYCPPQVVMNQFLFIFYHPTINSYTFAMGTRKSSKLALAALATNKSSRVAANPLSGPWLLQVPSNCQRLPRVPSNHLSSPRLLWLLWVPTNHPSIHLPLPPAPAYHQPLS